MDNQLQIWELFAKAISKMVLRKICDLGKK